jgi:hypothetical protein
MKRCIALAGALGLWAVPVAAQELRLDPPTLSAQADRCGEEQRALCSGLGERASNGGLSCDACRAQPMPADLSSPRELSSPPGMRTRAPECLPRTGAALPSCLEAPRLDNIRVP